MIELRIKADQARKSFRRRLCRIKTVPRMANHTYRIVIRAMSCKLDQVTAYAVFMNREPWGRGTIRATVARSTIRAVHQISMFPRSRVREPGVILRGNSDV